jgi:hypothetical protein
MPLAYATTPPPPVPPKLFTWDAHQYGPLSVDGGTVLCRLPCTAAMGFPCTPTSRIRSNNDAVVVARYLGRRHPGHYMVRAVPPVTWACVEREQRVWCGGLRM